MADRITVIECFPVRPRWLFVRVETAQGAVGWGEATLEGHVESVIGAIDGARDRLIGHDPAGSRMLGNCSTASASIVAARC